MKVTQLSMIAVRINLSLRENFQDRREMALACNTMLMEPLFSRDILEMTNTMDGGIAVFIQVNTKKEFMMVMAFCHPIMHTMKAIFLEDSSVEKASILLDLK